MIEVSQLTQADQGALGDLVRLLPQLRATHPHEHQATLSELEAIVRNENVALFVARDEGRIVGMASLYAIQKLGKRGGHVEDVVVDEGYRGHGIGRKLMEALVAWARANQLRQLYLTTNPTRVAAHKLYESLGFKQRETDVYKLLLG